MANYDELSREDLVKICEKQDELIGEYSGLRVDMDKEIKLLKLLLKEQVEVILPSCLLTRMKVELIGRDNSLSFDGYHNLTILWIEHFIDNSEDDYPFNAIVWPTRIEWSGVDTEIRAYYFGCEIPDLLKLKDYNKTWRCWTKMPTEAERKEVEWDAAE